MLSFRITDENRKATLVKRVPRGYQKNGPSWTVIPAGNHMVFEVSLNPNEWTPDTLPEKGKSRTVRIQAIFEIREDEDSKEHKVWTGKVFSKERTYTIHR